MPFIASMRSSLKYVIADEWLKGRALGAAVGHEDRT